jgi:hypothetical protein
MMARAKEYEAHDLLTAKQRLVRRVLAVVGAGMLGVGAFVIYELATEDRAVAPCKHLASFGDPRAVELLVQYTQHRVVIDHLIDTKPVTIQADGAYGRCKEALDILEHAMTTSISSISSIAPCKRKQRLRSETASSRWSASDLELHRRRA